MNIKGEDLGFSILALLQQVATLTEERDQARRMYCSTMADCLTVYCAPEDIATDRGWDCYKKEDGK
jgi:hypothetical protein